MKNNEILILVFTIAITAIGSEAYAQSKRFVIDKSAYEALSAENPFKSQLPPPKPPPPPEPIVTKKPEPVKRDKPKPIEVTPEPEIFEPPTLNIIGLVWNSDRPQAIVNGKVIDVGDTLEDAKVTNITKKGIEVEYKGRTLLMKP